MHKTKVSRAVSALERRKLTDRRENRADRRETFLSLTPASRAILPRSRPALRSNSQDACSKPSNRPRGVRAGH